MSWQVFQTVGGSIAGFGGRRSAAGLAAGSSRSKHRWLGKPSTTEQEVGLYLEDLERDCIVAAEALACGGGVEGQECVGVEVHAEVVDIGRGAFGAI